MSYIDEIIEALEASNIATALDLIEKHRAEYGLKPEFITVQAMLCLKTQEFDTACDILHDGVKRYPENSDLLFNLGHVYQCMGNKKQAIKYYEYAAKYTDDVSIITEINQICMDIKDLNTIEVSIITGEELSRMDFPEEFIQS